MRLTATLMAVMLFISLVLAGLIASASARETEKIGKAEFERHCASCHGVDGKGTGWVAKMLTKRPADLTQLSKANDGRFPFFKLQKIIDGREPIVAHGKREMPVWGSRFNEQVGGPNVATTIRGRILELLVYLKSIQAG